MLRTWFIHVARFAAAVICAVWGGQPLAAQESAGAVISGPVWAVDGDLLVVGGRPVRLYGIAAPAAGDICGGAALGPGGWGCGAWVQAEVRARYAGRQVTCFERARTADGPLQTTCYHGVEDLGSVLVRAGLAFADAAQSSAYVRDGLRARRVGAGLWAVGVDGMAQVRVGSGESGPGESGPGASGPEPRRLRGVLSGRIWSAGLHREGGVPR